MTDQQKLTMTECMPLKIGDFTLLCGEVGEVRFLCVSSFAKFSKVTATELLDLMKQGNFHAQKVTNEGYNFVISLEQLIDLEKFIEESIEAHRRTDTQEKYLKGCQQLDKHMKNHREKKDRLNKEFKAIVKKGGLDKKYQNRKAELIKKYGKCVKTEANASLLYILCQNLYIRAVVLGLRTEEAYFKMIKSNFSSPELLTDISKLQEFIGYAETTIDFIIDKD